MRTRSKKPTAVDIVHSLSQQDRQDYLSSGFIRNTFKSRIPNEIQCLIHEYATFNIQSDLEIEKGKEIRIVMLGAGAVGKSAIIVRFVENEWRKEYDATISDDYRASFDVDQCQRNVKIVDTAGSCQFEQFGHWIHESDAAILVYACNSERTFKYLNTIYQGFIMKNCNDRGRKLSVVMVGNKTDLPYEYHEVSYNMGKVVADSWDIPFIETSAKTGDNVEEAFKLLVRILDKETEQNTKLKISNTNHNENPCCTLL